MARRPVHLVLIAALAVLCCASAQAQWKWRDAHGQLHVSDLPPPSDVPDKSIVQRPAGSRAQAAAPAGALASSSAASSAASSKAPVDPELQARMKKAEQERDAKRKQEEERTAAARSDNCKRAQEYLRSLESDGRLTRVDEKGERYYVDDSTRAAEAQRARDVIASDCR
jgi:hypothetical protein